MHDFEDIRPYHDDEVRAVIASLLDDMEFSSAMAGFKHPTLYGMFPGLMARLVRSVLRKELNDVRNIHDVQVIIEKYLDNIIETTTQGLTQNGLEQLDPDHSNLLAGLQHFFKSSDWCLCRKKYGRRQNRGA